MKVVIVLPTYNERDNIVPLIGALREQFGRLEHQMHVLVVDDHSPDGTADAVRELQAVHDNLHLLEGAKRGLGVAYKRGIQYAIDTLRADVVMQMDADFSHKPEDVPRLLQALEQGHDFVIGSRYVRGGSIPRSWGALRHATSFFGNVTARYLAGIYRVRDCTAGFRAIRVSLLRRMDMSTVDVQGYAFQVALLHAATISGARVLEIPVDFVDRHAGESKLGFSDVVEFVINAWWIRLRSSRTFISFLAVGASGVAVNLLLFTLLLSLGLSKFLASPIAIEASIVSNFLLNNFWTFRERSNSSGLRIRGLKFNLVSLLALALSYGTFIVFSLLHPDGIPQLHQLYGIIPATLVNYFLNSYWTFRDEQPQSPDAPRRSLRAAILGGRASAAHDNPERLQESDR